MQRKSLWKLSAALALPVLAFTASSQAVVVYSTGGFETPTYNPGALGGQDGWTDISDPTNTHTAAITSGGNAPTTPQAVTFTSTQTIAGDNVAQYFRLLNFTPGGAGSGTEIVDVKFDMKAPAFANTPNLKTIVGIEAHNVNDDNLGAAYAGYTGGANTRVYDALAGGPNEHSADSGVATGSYANYEIILDFVNSTSSVKVNGTTLLTTTFLLSPGGGGDLSYLNLAYYNGNGEAVLFDNLSVTATPEPASLSILGLAGLGLLARRRK